MRVFLTLPMIVGACSPQWGIPGDAPTGTDALGRVQGGADGGGPRFAGLADIGLKYSVINSAMLSIAQSLRKTLFPATTL